MYEIDRAVFIEHYLDVVFDLVNLNTIKKDLIQGGEFILTAEELLQSLSFIPGKLVGTKLPVKSSECKLVYKS